MTPNPHDLSLFASTILQSEESVRIRVSGEWMSAALHLPTGEGEAKRPKNGWPSLLVLHGFMGCKAGPHRLFVQFARMLAARGVVVLRVDMRGHGDSAGDSATNTLERQLEDVAAASAWLRTCGDTDPLRLMLLGHSLGGMLAALSLQEVQPSRALLWSPTLPDYFLQFMRGGRIPAAIIHHDGWPLSPTYLQGLTRAHPLKAAAAWGGEAAVIHGDADEACPREWGERYAKALGTGTQLALIDGAGHTFDAPEHAETLLTLSLRFVLGQELKPESKRQREARGGNF